MGKLIADAAWAFGGRLGALDGARSAVFRAARRAYGFRIAGLAATDLPQVTAGQ